MKIKGFLFKKARRTFSVAFFVVTTFLFSSFVISNNVLAKTMKIGSSTTDISQVIGKMGIGTDNPGATLQINPAASTEGLRIISSNYSPFVIRNSANTADLFRIDQSGNIVGGNAGSWTLNGNNLYPVSTSYNVGIGTTTTGSYALNVSGTANFTGNVNVLNPSQPTHAANKSYVDSVSIALGAAPGSTLRSNGDYWVSNSNLYNNGTNVGIGTTNPTQKLTVFGNVGFDTGKFTTDGSGNATFESFLDRSNALYKLDPSNTGTSLNVAGSGVFGGNVTMGDLIVNGGDITVNNNNGGVLFSDNSAYWLRTATNWGLYWDTSANQFKFNGGGTTRASIDLDTGEAYFNGSVSANKLKIYQQTSGISGASAPSTYSSGTITHHDVYGGSESGWPTSYGNLLTIMGRDRHAAFQIFQTGSMTADLRVRSTWWDNSVNGWGSWRQVAFTDSPSFSGNIYFPGAGIWNSSGNVGIGTTNPQARLDLGGGASGRIVGIDTNPAAVRGDSDVVPKKWIVDNFAPIGTGAGSAFVQGGNSFGTKATLGTNDSQTLAFETAGSERITILSGGNVGIGNTNPSTYKLDVTSDIRATGNIYANDKIITSRYGHAGTYDSTQVQGIWSIGDGYQIDATNNNFGGQYGIVYAHTNAGTGAVNKPIAGFGHQILFVNNGSYKAAISLDYGHAYFNGNVGIGTTSPTQKLTVAGNVGFDTGKFTTDGSGNTTFESFLDRSNALYKLDPSNTGTSLYVAGTVSALGTATNNYFAGNVGIGTASPENSEGWMRVLNVYGSSNSKIITSTNLVQTGMWAHNSSYYSAPAGGFAGTKTNHPYSLITNGASRLTVSANGNVGIGTTNPVAKLEINSAGAFNPSVPGTFPYGLHFASSATSGHGSGITWAGFDSRESQAGIYVNTSVGATNMYFATTDNFDPGAQTRMTINSGGKVGIGTTNPTEALHVLGNIKLSGVLLGDTNSARNLVANNVYSSSIAGYQHTNGKTLISGNVNRIIFSKDSSYLTNYSRVLSPGYYSVSFWYKVENYVSGTSINVNLNDISISNFDVSSNKPWTFYSGVVYISNTSYGFLDMEGTFSSTITVSDIVVTRSTKPATQHVPAPEDFIQYNTSGDVGIGTTAPLDKLHLGSGSLRISSLLNCSGTGQAVKTDTSGRLVCGSVSGGITGSGTTSYVARWTGTSTLGKGVLYDNGTNVGVGTTAPINKLTIIDTPLTGAPLNSSDTMDIVNNGTVSLNMIANTSGDINLLFSDTTRAMGEIKYKNSDNSLRFRTNNVADRMIINSSGNVGIGATNPTTKLYVNGDTTNTGYLSITGAQNTSGNIRFSAGNPYISASSYIVIPGGIYVSGGTPYFTNKIEARGGIHNDTASYLTVHGGTSGNTYFNGNVGIGTTAPGSKLDVQTAGYGFPLTSGAAQTYGGLRISPPVSSGGVVLDMGTNGASGVWLQATLRTNLANTYPLLLNPNGGNVGIGTTSPSVKLEVNGDVKGASFTYTSDISYKKDVETIENPIAKIQALRGVRFNWKKDNTPAIGLIAQEVEKVFPEVVIGEEGNKGVSYGALVAPLIEAVKAQQEQIDSLRERIELLEKKN